LPDKTRRSGNQNRLCHLFLSPTVFRKQP
jgi:hypothetical protein